MLRPGNAGSNTSADHIAVTKQALAQLPTHRVGHRPGRRVLVRTDGAGATHAFLDFLAAQRVSYSIGFTPPTDTGDNDNDNGDGNGEWRRKRGQVRRSLGGWLGRGHVPHLFTIYGSSQLTV